MTDPAPVTEATDNDLLVVTCSMARDIGLFSLLAQSVDEWVADEVPHLVVVPGADLGEFRRFATARRQIVAQEDVLPFRVFKFPAALKLLAPISPALRRPLYIDARLRLMRGWILQQLLKIETSAKAVQKQVMHVDSDVFFFRAMRARDAFVAGKPCFFHADGINPNPLHAAWISASADVLGVSSDPGYRRHYVDNCVTWSSSVARAMTDRIEKVHGRPWHDMLAVQPSFSEYYLYGVFVDLVHGTADLHPRTASFCHSFWPSDRAEPFDAAGHLDRAGAGHYALAVQSTHPLSLESRRALYQAARTRFAPVP